ncbi:MAG TPA: alpha-amylase family glycosyl hydrolase, partial [Dongiaceae bacterium]|nr:alpha-amylase family glycosyl hydrolase [Dongiaceae bacterium]
MPRYPSLLEINTRPWLRRLSPDPARPVTLTEVDDAVLDGFQRAGFDWIWLLSVWEIGPLSRAVSREVASPWHAECVRALPDLTEADIAGSGFAIAAYRVNEALGGAEALAGFRARLARRGIKLMLDFVPNHT